MKTGLSHTHGVVVVVAGDDPVGEAVGPAEVVGVADSPGPTTTSPATASDAAGFPVVAPEVDGAGVAARGGTVVMLPGTGVAAVVG